MLRSYTGLMSISLLLCMCILGLVGCASIPKSEKPLTEPKGPVSESRCPMPRGYALSPEILDVGKQTLIECPDKLDDVFNAFLSICKTNRQKNNGQKIRDTLKELADQGKIDAERAKELVTRYFSVKFFCIPQDVRALALKNRIEKIKNDMNLELRQKREGFVDCCNDIALYEKAKREHSRIVQLMENLIMCEEFNTR